MLPRMRSRVLVISSIVAACSGSAPRSSTPPPTTSPAPVATPAVVPATPPAIAPLVVAQSDAGFAFRDPDRRKKLEAAFPAIEKMIDEEMTQQTLPGLAFGIVIDGELAYAKGFGVTSVASKTVPDADTVYRIGSITKSFTGLALLALRDDGVLQLDEPLAKWIPEAGQLVYPTRDSRAITLRQLANHTSGLPRMGRFEPENGPNEEVVVKSLGTLALDAAPGTRWNYSNLAFSLLGIVIAHAARAPYHDVVAARILKPLGMTATAWDHAEVPADKLAPAHVPGPKGPTTNPKPARLGAADGAGGIYSSVRDMAKYVAFQLAAYPPRSAEDAGTIHRATVREAHSTGVAMRLQTEGHVSATSYGYGWAKEQSCELDDVVGHNGAIDSYRSAIGFSPSRGVGVIALTNFGMGNPDKIVERAFGELEKTKAFVPRAPGPSPELSAAMTRLLAVYHQWDEAALKAILARPVDPREQGELATYKQLHGTCTGFEPSEIESPRAGAFALKCERGTFAIQLSVDAQGLIEGFVGLSRGVEAPAAVATAVKAIVALNAKWDDKLYAKHFAKSPISAAQAKALAVQFHARHGDCTIKQAIHEAFDWGYELTCKKENVELWPMPMPNDPTQFVGLRLQPLRTEPKRCPAR